MASTTLYPPIVDSYTPAFIASGDSAYCRLYYSLSKFSSSVDTINSIHISIVKQSSGQSVVNRKDGNGRFRSTGIVVLNSKPIAVAGQENLYYTDILNEDIKNGWTVGWKYKIQIRFGTVAYTDNTIGLASWLNLNTNNFSEWSTYTVTKAINEPEITIPNFNYNSSTNSSNGNKEQIYNIFTSTLELTGSYTNIDEDEILYSYKFKLYDSDGNLLEDSDLIYANQYTPNQLYYLFKTEFKNDTNYKLEFNYETLNKYTDVKVFDFHVSLLYTTVCNIKVLTAEDEDLMSQYTSIEEEQSDGRIALKLYSLSDKPFFGNICIRRSDSTTNFSVWDDIKILSIKAGQNIDAFPLVYDYTIESGVWYKYGVQIIDDLGFRGALLEKEPIKREFEYSFLLGENNQQLRLKFDNVLSNFKHTYGESKIDTIGGKYPFIIRNGNVDYKTFPINGLISFNMDDNNLFINKKDIYKHQAIVDLYFKEEKTLYDYTYERDFREEVLKFLGDGKPKLFKSPTEGNIIVRLMDVNTTPNQTLNRLIYSFSSNAYEIAEATMNNYLKYNFYTIGKTDTNLIYTENKLGQYIGKVPIGSNLFKLIENKYSNQNMMGYTQTVVKIKNLVLYFPDKNLNIENNANQLVSGYNIKLNNSLITVYNNIYIFDELTTFTPKDQLIILGDKNGQLENVDIEVDFVYEVVMEPIKEKIISVQETSKNIGQFAENMYSGDSVYTNTYYKYFYNSDSIFRKLYEFKCIAIEANPNAVFLIKDLNDLKGQEHTINLTGVLNLYDAGSIKDIIYLGMRNSQGEIDYSIPCDVVVDYIFYLIEGEYVKEG